MTGTIKLTVIDDDTGSGKALTNLDGTALPAPTLSASVVGNCIGRDDMAGKADPGSHIIHQPDAKGTRCDLADGTKLKIKLDIDFPNTTNVAFFPPRIPILCINDAPNVKDCGQTYARFLKFGQDQTTAIFALQKLDGSTTYPKYYRINFMAPVGGKTMMVTLDPKVINKPRIDADVALALLGIVVAGAATLVAQRLLQRTGLTAERGFALSVLGGLIVGVIAVLIARNVLFG